GALGTPLPLLDRLVSGGPVNLGLAAILGGSNPVPGSVQELQALAGTPLDRRRRAARQRRRRLPEDAGGAEPRADHHHERPDAERGGFDRADRRAGAR